MQYETDQSLIEGLLTKDEAAFRHAITSYQPAMLSLARSIAGESIADEVVQEAWLSAMKALPKFEGRSTLKTWLMRIVANEAKTRLRKENRNVSLEALTHDDADFAQRFNWRGHWIRAEVPVEWSADSPEGLLSSEQLKDCLDRVITNLPEAQAATLKLREQQGHSLAEICNILEVSESNVRVLLHRARNRVLKAITHYEKTGDCVEEN